MSSEKITTTAVKNLQPGQTVWDTKITGFGVRRQRKAPFYLVKTRIHGRQRWFTIGQHGQPADDDGVVWTPDTARKKATIILGEIAKGENPAATRNAKRHRPDVDKLMDDYLEKYARREKKKSSVDLDKSHITNHIRPLLGDRAVIELTKEDIRQFRDNVADGKTERIRKDGIRGGTAVKGGAPTANRCVALLSKAFNLAIEWGWRIDNPVKLVSKLEEKAKERYLSETELSALAETLKDEESAEGANVYAIGAIRLLIFTGARRGEILGLRWKDVDLERGFLHLEDSKTGKKSIYLNAPAHEILAALPREKGNPFVISGAKEGTHLVNLRKIWARVTKTATLKLWLADPYLEGYLAPLTSPTFPAATKMLTENDIEPTTGIMDLRIHDLRHSYASFGATGGLSLPILGKLLGHSQSSTTERYAHLADDPVRRASEQIGAALSKTMSGNATSEENP